jgi:hypothetical protein
MATPAPRECNQPARNALHRKQSAHGATIRTPCSAAQRIASQPARSASARASHPVHRIALHRILYSTAHRANATSPTASQTIRTPTTSPPHIDHIDPFPTTPLLGWAIASRFRGQHACGQLDILGSDAGCLLYVCIGIVVLNWLYFRSSSRAWRALFPSSCTSFEARFYWLRCVLVILICSCGLKFLARDLRFVSAPFIAGWYTPVLWCTHYH